MQVSCITFTQQGYDLGVRMGEALPHEWATSRGFGADKEELHAWCEGAFADSDALVFVGALGIAVRAIAPFLRLKTTDPAVVVVDEGGKWAIPVLSGHIGGANELAREIEGAVGAVAVITTATDGRGLWAVDSWATKQGLAIANPQAIKTVSSWLLAGRYQRLYSQVSISGEPPQGISFIDSLDEADIVVSYRASEVEEAVGIGALALVPPAISAGFGCKSGVDPEAVEEAFAAACQAADIDGRAVACLSSIDVKSDEPGLAQFAQSHGLSLRFYPAERLACVEGSVSSSDFVESAVGVDNVCERAALAQGGKLASAKFAHHGVTFAFAVLDFELSF